MKTSVKIAALFIVVVLVALALFMLKDATKPESAIIAAERDKLVRSLDNARAQQDENYFRELEDKLQFLGYRLAMAYAAENKPDEAITVLEKLIKDEEAKSPGTQRRSRSYYDEARFYEAMIGAFELKKDEDGANKAARVHDELMARASELKKLEERGEGKSVGMNAP